MAVNFDKIVKYTINSVCESNLHIGSSVGGKEEVLVHPVTGVPFIQASSIAGVFRRNYEKLYNDSDKLFGARSMNANSNASEFESRVKFTDGIFDNNSLKLEIRPHVRIDKVSGTVMQERGSGQKLEMEYVGQGSKFTMEVYLYIESKDKTAYEKSIESILSLMCKGEITFGAKKSSGSGKVIPDTIYKKVFDMTNEADRKEWNRDDEKDSSKELNNGEVIYSNTENKIDSVNESNVAYTIKISGKTEGAIMVKGIAVSEFGKGAPDCENIKNAKKENIIPGTSIRGVVINSIVKNHPSEFEKMKKILFSDKVKFLNAYLFENNKELIPSPKGFYEDKKTAKEYKEVENVVVKGDLTPGNKRAGLGRYCYFEGENIFCYDVETGSDMKIKIKDDSNIFRSEYIAVGHKFVGYISIDDESVKDTIEEVFKNDITIGNAKSQAMGRCIVEENNFVDDSNIPYSNYAVDKSVEKECYMMILSNTAMRNDLGEYVGIDLEKLKNLMNVSNLKIERCSTSVVNVKGYNRVWGTKIPSVNMYEIGSVFKLTFDGEFSIENVFFLPTTH